MERMRYSLYRWMGRRLGRWVGRWVGEKRTYRASGALGASHHRQITLQDFLVEVALDGGHLAEDQGFCMEWVGGWVGG